MPSGPLAVCATDDRLGDRIQAVLQQAGHEAIGCALPLDQAFASAHASRAQALRETGYGRDRVVLKRAELAHPGAVAACVTRDLE